MRSTRSSSTPRGQPRRSAGADASRRAGPARLVPRGGGVRALGGQAPADRARVGEGGEDRRRRSSSTRRAPSGSGRRRSSTATRASRAFPYAEYSEVFFGDEYRVLRGGSWVTDPLVARPTFRNWDLPQRRQIFSGIRCASRCLEHGDRCVARPRTRRRARACIAEPKELPTVWLYDERGSRLYEEITRLPDYYLPRREAEILRARAERDRRADAGAHARRARRREREEHPVSCSDALDRGTLERFVPLDVSERDPASERAGDRGRRTRAVSRRCRSSATSSATSARCRLGRPAADRASSEARSGTCTRSSARRFLEHARRRARARTTRSCSASTSSRTSRDSRRRTTTAAGVTEAFVRNALTAVNRELDATFEQRRFVYEARWDPEHEWMDIGLRARQAHTVSVRRLELELAFEEGERAPRRDQLEVPARAVRARERVRPGSRRRVVVDRPCGRLRALVLRRGPEAKSRQARGDSMSAEARSAATSTRSR